MYRIIRNILFLFPAEWAHYFSMNCLKAACRIGFTKLIAAAFRPKTMDNRQWAMSGLTFKNPIGLGAGFDKNAKWLRELECLGFGFVEIGTVTPLPQRGNDKPRLFRLPKDKALINRMGFNNDGVKAIAERLRQWAIGNGQSANSHLPLATRHPRLIIGGNIGKNKSTLNEDAWKDYETCFKELNPYVDYFVVNVSSPNTPGLRELQEKESLRKILEHLITINETETIKKPLLLKISPDLNPEQLDDIIDLALEIKLDGLVVTNTTVNRDQLATKPERVQKIGAGGLSGAPLRQKSTTILNYIHGKTKGNIPVIASGGIYTGSDAKEKLDAGASLVQVWTGFIYEGPGIVKKIMKFLNNSVSQQL